MDWHRRDKRDDEEDEDTFFDLDKIDEEFEKMREYIDNIFKKTFRERPELEKGTPFIYGISMRVGKDGKPHIREFGNTKQKSLVPGKNLLDGQEPLTDIIEGEKSISITVELSGVEKEEINLITTNETLTIDVNTADRKYHKVIEYPCEVDLDSIRATFKNGVLDITINRKFEKKQTGKKVEIN